MILLAGPGVALSTVCLGVVLKVRESMCLDFIVCYTIIAHLSQYSLLFRTTGVGKHHCCLEDF